MNLRLRLAQKLARLARWMPARLRDRFGDEIEQVLSEHLLEAAGQGWFSFLRTVLRELVQFPGIHLRQRLSPGASVHGGITMSEQIENILADTHEPTSWGWALVGLLPFFFSWIYWGFAKILGGLFGIPAHSSIPLHMQIFSHAFFALVVLVSAILVIAWTRGFPAWSYTLGFYFFVFSLYLYNASMPGLTLFGYQFGRRILRGFALIPLGVVVLVSLILTRKNPSAPVLKGVNDLARDFSRASLGLFGLTPFFLRLLYDEVIGEEIFLMVVDLILAACALVYLRARRTAVGLIVLFGSQFAIFSISAVFMGIYWNGPHENFTPSPGSGWQNFFGSLFCILPVFFLTLFPWLLHLFKRHSRLQ